MAADNKNRLDEYYPLVVVSDMHLGMRFRDGQRLTRFLETVNTATLVMNGDIVDGERINLHPPRDFSEGVKGVFDAVAGLAARGTKVVYLPGNHDHELRRKNMNGAAQGGITFAQEMNYTAPSGKTFLMLHGDRFENDLKPLSAHPGWFIRPADIFFSGVVGASEFADNIVHKTLGARFNPVATLIDARDTLLGKKQAFEGRALKAARDGGFAGVVTGHSHKPYIKTAQDGVIFANSGDWASSFTALGMKKSGEWDLIRWHELSDKERQGNEIYRAENKTFRSRTEKILSDVRKMWPGLR